MAELATTLGPATEALIARAFAETALLPASSTAQLLGVDEKTLRTMREVGLIRAVLIGEKTHRYAEADVRAYIAGQTAAKEKTPCPSTNRRSRATGTTISNIRAVDFMAPRAKSGRARR